MFTSAVFSRSAIGAAPAPALAVPPVAAPEVAPPEVAAPAVAVPVLAVPAVAVVAAAAPVVALPEVAAASTATAGAVTTGTASAGAAPIAERLKTADATKGAEISKKCVVCHNFTKGGGNKIGPNLWGIVGSKPGEVPDYSFSDAMKARADKPWTFEALDEYLTAPRKDVPGTKMTFAGLPKPQDRADLIAWLRQQSDSPVPLP